MRSSDRSPSIVPPGNDQDVYLVLDDFDGRLGQAWRESAVESTRLETVLADLLDGQYSNPVRVIAFNTAEGWSRDVSEDVAHELRRRCAEQARDLPSSLEQFVESLSGPISRLVTVLSDSQIRPVGSYKRASAGLPDHECRALYGKRGHDRRSPAAPAELAGKLLFKVFDRGRG